MLPKPEMYAEHVPRSTCLSRTRWSSKSGGRAASWFRSGMVWNIGKGRVFYFRPGHETYPMFKEKLVLPHKIRRPVGRSSMSALSYGPR